jgi:hypothetical protein
MTMPSFYQSLMRLYPATHRQQFGEEMLSVFHDVRAELADKGIFFRTRFYIRETAGLLKGALHERLHGFFGAQFDLESSMRRFTMQKEFRFPKATAVLMTIILLGVLSAIKRGEDIAYSLPQISEPVAPIHPVHSGLLPPIPVFFACFYAVGLVGWAILFALRRSGVHRLANMSGDR